MNEGGVSSPKKKPAPIPGPAILFLLVVLMFDGILGWMIFNQLRVARFPTTPGVVEAVSVRQDNSSTSAHVSHCPEVAFRYQVNHEALQGNRFRWGGFCSSHPQDVERVMGNLVPGEAHAVYVHPDKPRVAYLSAGIGAVEHAAGLLLLPFNLFAVGWLLEIFARKVLGRSLEPDVMRFGQENGRAWARFPHLGPIQFALGVLLIIAFLVSLVTVFFFAVLPAAYFSLTWRILLLLGVGLLAGKALWNAFRSMTVTFDPHSRELTLPSGAVLPKSQIEDWRIEEIRGRAKRAVYFRPVLQHRAADGVKQTLELPLLSSREEAYRFGGWLVETVGLANRQQNSLLG
ncbi:MAG: DUF3592 domain-containing protein [Acidobacteriota bacterium]